MYSCLILPRCMECKRGLAMRILSVCPFVCPSVRPSLCLSNAWIVTKLNKNQSRFLYHTKDHKADFRFIFARCASAVTSSEKSSFKTNRKSTTRFPMSPRWTSFVFHKTPPQGWIKNTKCLKFEQEAAITPQRYEIGCQLLLITNRKSHGLSIGTDLNDLKWP